jgi:hypothetical protein
MMKDAEESIKIMTSEAGVQDLVDNHADTLQEAKEQGINVKVLAPATEENEQAFNQLSEFAEVRHLGGLEEKLDEIEAPEGEFSIIDNESLTMSMTHDEVHETQDTAFWSKSEHLADSVLDPMFDVMWHQSDEPEQAPETPGNKPGQ